MKRILSVAMCIAVLAVTICTATISPVSALSENIADTSDFSLSSIELTENMLVGYNIGDYMDSAETRDNYTRPQIDDMTFYKETLWGNVPVTEEYIKYLKSLGVQSIRLPITWYTMLEYPEGTTTPYSVWYSSTKRPDYWYNGVINKDYLARVKQVVDWILENDMYCIINTHHDGACNKSNPITPLVFDEAHKEQSTKYITNIWSQVGEYFKDYGSKLLFEAYNEVADNSGNMSPNADREAAASDILETFIKLIRSQGSNNANRFLVCPEYGGVALWSSMPFAAADTASDKLILTMHSYPSASGVDGVVKGARTRMDALNVGCIIDEIGGVPAAADDGIFSKNVRTASQKYKVSCFWWDNGQAEFALVNRYYCEPADEKALSNYVGKTVTSKIYTKDEVCDSVQPYYAEFYSADSDSQWAGKYVIVASTNKMTFYHKYVSRKEQGYYSMEGIEDGYITYYTSDDGINYTKMMTRYPTTFSELCYNDFTIYGSTENMQMLDSNYDICWHGGTFYTKDFDATISEGTTLTNASKWNTSAWGYINFKGINNSAGLANGAYFDIDIGKLQADTYTASIGAVGTSSNSPMNVSLVYDDGTVKEIGSVSSFGKEVDIGEVTVDATQHVKIRFTATTTTAAKYAYVYFLKLTPKTDPSDTTTTTTTKPTTTTATTTTTTATTTTTTATTTTKTTTTTKPTTTTITTTTKPITTTQPTTTTTTTTTTVPATEKIMYGDVNSDEVVNAVDLLILKKYIVKMDVKINEKNTDVNFDGKYNAIDVLMIKKHIVKIPLAPWN